MIQCTLIGIARILERNIVEHGDVTDELIVMHRVALVPAEALEAEFRDGC